MSRSAAVDIQAQTDWLPRKRKLLRIGTAVFAHPVVDLYSSFVPPLIGVLQIRCELTAIQAASLLSVGSLSAGLSQPVVAWLSDRTDSRVYGAIGLFLAATCLSCIGLADDYLTLVLLFGFGMAGVGAFHPIAASTVGQLSGKRRAVGVTAFFVMGMIGAAIGPIVSTRITAIEPNGFALLRWMMIPGLITAAALYLAIRDVPHRHHEHSSIEFEPRDIRSRWSAVLVLFVGNAMRYGVNMAMLYLLVRWAEAYAAATGALGTTEIAKLGSLHSGLLTGMMMAGMGIGGLAAGSLVKAGKEKWPLVLIPLFIGPLIALFPLATLNVAFVLAVATGIGYAGVIPVTIGLSQRLLPHRTSFASSMTMGTAWIFGMLGPLVAAVGVKQFGLPATFAATATVLAVSGLIGLLLPVETLRRSGE